ncbi:MAG: nitrophenyl compound nitroreductase subunit ArsF family protein [Paludibacter sp.]|nr:nitrophenyl compound nitroreductase subunit ArsF family protein [Paludibacter sp.]MDD4197793.1 nitrophenyl compound nitroreductase subunit ArsF family protein [Paludibacter sp.]MDD4428017.1 nitrophenyl compound nitroreductase subunit ArsF family protein [Paludibacter sp.]
MKKVLLFCFMLTFLFGNMSCEAQSKQKQQQSEIAVSDKVDVYYFHYTRRCVTCNTVESETKKHLEVLYPELVKNGKITFTSVNLEEAGSKAIAEKCGATGQSLLVVSGNKKTDLTQAGFMYARSQPEKLKAEIKLTLDPLVKK